MFKKDVTLKSFKNKVCKIDIKIFQPSEDLYIVCKTAGQLIRLYTDCSSKDFTEPFWKEIEFHKALDSLLENVMFVNVKKKFSFRGRAYTIRKTVENYINAVKFAADFS